MAKNSGQASSGLLALLAAWAVGLPALLHYVGGREARVGADVHFWLVASGATVAAVASIALTIGGVRARDSRTVLLGAAFSTMTALLAIHAIATPGILVGPNGVIALAGGASLPAGAAVLALSALPAMRRPVSLRPVLALQAGLAVAIIGLGHDRPARPLRRPERARRPAAARRSRCSSSAPPASRCSPCAPRGPTR